MPASLLEMLPPLWHVIASNDFIYKPHCRLCEAVSGTNFVHLPASYYNQMEKFPLSWNTSCIFLPKSSGILFLKKKKKKKITHTHTILFLSEIKAYNNEKEKNKTKLGYRHFAADTHQCVLLSNIMFKHKENYSMHASFKLLLCNYILLHNYMNLYRFYCL